MRPAEAAITLQEAIRAEEERRRGLLKRKEACEQDLLEFIRTFWHVLEPKKPLVDGWVLHALCDLLMAVTDGHVKRAIINVPPGSGKSLILNVFFPAWEWGPCNMAHLRYIAASYNEELPERDNRKFLKLLEHPDYQRFWGDRVKLIARSASLVESAATGWKRTTSTHSGTTGHRGDRILIDDANDPNNVESDAVRGATTHWLREVMPDRLNDLDRDVIINLQQRTHELDATGILADLWEAPAWLMIPMEYDPLRDTPVVMRRDDDGEPLQLWRDPRGLDGEGCELEGIFLGADGNRKIRSGSPMAMAEGVLCWPERFPPHVIPQLKKEKGPYAWAAQYDQSPTIRGGNIIREDWWQLWPHAEFPALGTVVASLDTAIKEGETNDYNAFTSWGAFAAQDGVPKLILTSAWRARMSLAELVRRTAEGCYEAKVDYLLIEDKARGHDVAAEIARQYADAPWQTILIPANGRGAFSGDKVARLRAVSVMFSGDVRKVPRPGGAPGETMDLWTGGMIYEPGREWSQEVVKEVAGFPSAAHDDYVDSVSMALSWIRRHGVVVRQVEHEAAETEARRYRSPVGVPYAITG
jgi:phage terminase large subunit-like protein